MAKRSRLPAAALAYFREQGSRGGRKGGALSWANLTPAERSERARKASAAAAKARRAKARAKSSTN